ncbi:hypothetical protein FIBSPDRAFT_291876 [Athelia psychrophila]|uniref:Uncharacterized protein n=1 Tax=Athelia psychrophila TaxID=1759441 RepID=A0A166QY81_9AGAM|nr:hypothetical protein FIBSPDRAFT_291876 [Fibularhizoctonia sp. CBS 109695]
MPVPPPPPSLEVPLHHVRRRARAARGAALQRPHAHLVAERALREQPRHLRGDVARVEAPGVRGGEPDARRARGDRVVDRVEPLAAHELREAVRERLVERVAAAVVHRDLHRRVRVHQRRVVQPPEHLHRLAARPRLVQCVHGGEVEIALGQLPEEAHAAGAGARGAEERGGAEHGVDLALVVAEDGAHVEVHHAVPPRERGVQPRLHRRVLAARARRDGRLALRARADEDDLVERRLLAEVDVRADDRDLVRPARVELGERAAVDRAADRRELEHVQAVRAQRDERGVVQHARDEVRKVPHVEERRLERHGRLEVRPAERLAERRRARERAGRRGRSDDVVHARHARGLDEAAGELVEHEHVGLELLDELDEAVRDGLAPLEAALHDERDEAPERGVVARAGGEHGLVVGELGGRRVRHVVVVVDAALRAEVVEVQRGRRGVGEVRERGVEGGHALCAGGARGKVHVVPAGEQSRGGGQRRTAAGTETGLTALRWRGGG